MIEEPKCRPSFGTSNYIALFLTRKSDGNWTNGTVSPSPEVELDPSLSRPMVPQFLHPIAYKKKSELTMLCINTMKNPQVVSSKTQAAYSVYIFTSNTISGHLIITSLYLSSPKKEYLIVWRLTAMDWSISRSRSSTLWFRASIDWRRRSVMLWNLNEIKKQTMNKQASKQSIHILYMKYN